MTAVGAGLGIVLAGPIVDVLGYRWLFWLPMIPTIVAAVSAVLFVPESPVRTPGRISWLPAVLLPGWLHGGDRRQGNLRRQDVIPRASVPSARTPG
jgi:MFS family permease